MNLSQCKVKEKIMAMGIMIAVLPLLPQILFQKKKNRLILNTKNKYLKLTPILNVAKVELVTLPKTSLFSGSIVPASQTKIILKQNMHNMTKIKIGATSKKKKKKTKKINTENVKIIAKTIQFYEKNET